MGLDIEKVAMLTGMVDKLVQMKHVDNALDESIRFKHVLARAFWQIMSKPTGMTTEKLKFSRISGHDTRII